MYKQSSLVLALFLGSAASVQLKFQPSSLVSDYDGETHVLAAKEPNNEPFRPDIGRKELAQIDPHNPTGLEAAPHTQDTHPVEVQMQLRKPLIPENRSEANDCMNLQINEYPQPDIRGPMPKNAHPDSTFSSHLHNDWT